VVTVHKMDNFEAIPVSKSLKDEPLPNYTQLCCSSTQIVLLTQSGLIHTIDWPKDGKLKPGTREIRLNLKMSHIVTISASFSHIMALKRVESPPFVEWTPEMVGEWMDRIGFPNMSKLCVFGKISGKVWMEKEDEEEFLSV